MNVRFFGGYKEEYLNIEKHNPTGLYFCADTKELFWGDWLLSDGIRIVQTYADLPSIEEHAAAEGVIYFVEETKNGYVLPSGRAEWLQVIYAPEQGSSVDIDLSDYYTAVEVDEAILAAVSNITIPDTSSFITMEDVEAKNYLTALDIDGKADKGHKHDDLYEAKGAAEAVKNELLNGAGAAYDTLKELGDLINSKQEAIEALETIAAGKADKEHEHSQYIEYQDLTEYAKKSDIPDTSEFIKTIPAEYITETELEAKGYLTDHQDLSDYAKKTEIPSIEGLASKKELEDAINEIEHPSIDLSGYATEQFVKDQIKAIPDPDLSDYAKKTDIPDVESFATKEELEEAINAVEHPTINLENYVTKEEISGFIKEIPEEFITEEELTAKGYLTQQDIANKADNNHIHTEYADTEHTHTLSDITDYEVPEIPSIEGLASKEYVDDAIEAINIPTIPSLDGYATEEFVSGLLAIKADNIPFNEDKIVTKPIGNFINGESVKGLSIAEILAKLLGLSDSGDEPDIPTSLAEKLLSNKTTMYSVTNEGKLAEVAFKELDGNSAPTESGFFVIRNENNEIVKAGYQDISIVNDDMYYVIALPKELDYNTMVTLEAWNSEESIWEEATMPLISDPKVVAELCAEEPPVDISYINTDLYTIWVYEDTCTGSILRYVIKEV